MTLIQPTKNFSLAHFILLGLTFPLIAGVIWLIIIYNQTVDARHGIAELKGQLQQVEIQNAELKDRIFTILDPHSLEQIAASRSLIPDPKPRYVEVSSNNQWAFALHL